MKNSMKLLATASALVAASVATPAFAAGTGAGTSIENTATVNFSVGGVAQTAKKSNTDTFVVDRKVNFTLVEADNADTIVTPGAKYQVTTFTVTNSSNDKVSFVLAADQAATAKRGTDTFNVTDFRIFVESGTATGFNGTFDAQGAYTGSDTEITSNGYLQEVLADQSKTIYVLANVPVTNGTNNLGNTDVAAIQLTGTAWSNTFAGGVLTTSATQTANVVDTVLADAGYNGIETDRDAYKVETAAIVVQKYSRVVNDPVTTASNAANNTNHAPKMIPGATVEYCIAVSNTTAVNASGIKIVDAIPANTTYVAGSIVKDTVVNASNECTGGTAVTDAIAGADIDGFTSTAVDATLASILNSTPPQGSTTTYAKRGLRFQVTINNPTSTPVAPVTP